MLFLMHPLPIQLINFNAIVNIDKVDLNWTTASEINNNYFTIEKALDGISFKALTRVKGAGNSNQLLHYLSVDSSPYQGVSYYRLKQTDFDGNFTYSKTIAVNYLDNVNEFSFSIFPNPIETASEKAFFIQFKNAPNSNVSIRIYDLLGKEIYSDFLNNSENSDVVYVNTTQSLKQGIYSVEAVSKDKTIRQRIVVQ